MERVEKTVFLSYRRSNLPWALNIFQSLTHHGYDVFFDYNGIASGDFEKVILENIRARAHFLVLLTPSALEGCAEPGDWMRREVEAALTEKRNIVPLTLDGFSFSMPKIASQLTGVLGALKHYNALNIPPDYFIEAMERLRNRFLNVPLASVAHPASLSAQRAATEQQMAAAAAPASRDSELTAQQLVERGLAALNVDEQLNFYTEAIRVNSDYAEAFVYRGHVRRMTGDIAGALGDYSAALRLNIHDAAAFYNRGNARQLNGDLPGALHDFTEAIRLSPEDVDAFNNRGNVHRQLGKFEAAFQDFTEAIRLRPENAMALINRGSLRYSMGDSAGALQDYEGAIRLMSSLLRQKLEK